MRFAFKLMEMDMKDNIGRKLFLTAFGAEIFKLQKSISFDAKF